MSVRLVQGENAEFTIKLRDSVGDPFDLTNFNKFKICLPGLNGKIEISEVANANLSIAAITGDDILGKILVTLKAADTLLLSIGERQDIGLIIDNAGTPNPRAKNFDGSLSVEASPC